MKNLMFKLPLLGLLGVAVAAKAAVDFIRAQSEPEVKPRKSYPTAGYSRLKTKASSSSSNTHREQPGFEAWNPVQNPSTVDY